MRRTGRARFPFEQLWGPSVPKEMLRDEAFAAWQEQHPRVLTGSSRFMALMLSGAGLRGSPVFESFSGFDFSVLF